MMGLVVEENDQSLLKYCLWVETFTYFNCGHTEKKFQYI